MSRLLLKYAQTWTQNLCLKHGAATRLFHVNCTASSNVRNGNGERMYNCYSPIPRQHQFAFTSSNGCQLHALSPFSQAFRPLTTSACPAHKRILRNLPTLKASSNINYVLISQRNMNSKNKDVGVSFLSLRSLRSTPLPFMVYGLGGLIPFASAPLYMFYLDSYHPAIASAQLVYGACILSFLGGVAWGSDVKDADLASFQSLGYSILLPLVGWTSVLIHPNPLSFVVLISGVACAGYADTQFGYYPDWFKNLRFLLTSLVVLCLFSTFSFRLTKNSTAMLASASDNETNRA